MFLTKVHFEKLKIAVNGAAGDYKEMSSILADQ